MDNAGSNQLGEDGQHITFCRLCEALCGLVATVDQGRITAIRADRAHPVSAGHLCIKGPAMLQIAHDPDRVLRPLRRTGAAGEFEPVDWDEALDDIATRLRQSVDRSGGESLGFYVGNPAAFSTLHYGYAMAFHAALGGTRFFTAMHADTVAKNAAAHHIYGNALLLTAPDIQHCDFLLMLGANPLVSHMSLISEPRIREALDAIAARDGVVVVDPRRSETASRYEHVAVRPDGDAWLLAGLLRVLFEEELVSDARVDPRIESWKALRDAVLAIPFAHVEARSSVEAERVRDIARRFAGAKRAACYGRVGTNRGRFSTIANVMIEAMNLLTGRFGKKGGWGIPVRPFSATLPDAPPGEPPRSRIGNLPQIAGMAPGGLLAREILTSGPGQIRSLFVDCGNPVLSYPAGGRLEQALETLDLMVSIDLYVTETNRHAHYILPTTTFLERADFNDTWAGNASRPWIQFSEAVVPPIGDTRDEWSIYRAIGMRLGMDNPFAAAPPRGNAEPDYIDAADAMLRAGPCGDAFGGRAGGLTREILQRDHPSGIRYAESMEIAASWDCVAHVRLWNEVIQAEFDRMNHSVDTGGLRLIGRRGLGTLNSWMHNVERLTRSVRPTLLIHPLDAANAGIDDGDRARLSTPEGAVEIIIEISDEMKPGVVSYPHGWGHAGGGWRGANAIGGANINRLASDDPADLEPVSGASLLDGIDVVLTRLETRDLLETM